MALSRSSVLHFWSARFGASPRIGGRAVFSRNTAGTFLSQESEVTTAIVNTPRFDWATLSLPNGQTERRTVLTLEPARMNNLLWASDFSNAAYAKLNMPITTGILDPAGGTTACTLTASAANAEAYQHLSAGSSLVRSASVWLRRRAGVGVIRVLSADGTVTTPAVPTVDWQRFAAATAAASTDRWGGVRVDTSGDAVDAWLCQNEDGGCVTSGIQTTISAVARTADSLYWNFPPVPNAMMLYARLVERGTLADGTNPRVLAIGNAATAPPHLLMYTTGSFYRIYHDSGSGGAVASTLAVAPALGDTVELLGLIYADGSVEIVQSINGAAVTSAARSAARALAGTWSDMRLWLNSIGSTTVGSNQFADLRIVKFGDVVAATPQGRMDELRAFELGPNGDVL